MSGDAATTMGTGIGRHTFYMALKPEPGAGILSSITTFSNTDGTEERAQCCAKDMTTSVNCAESVTAGGGMKTERMVWGNDAPTNPSPWENKLPAVHTDLIVAATNQFSGTSLGGH